MSLARFQFTDRVRPIVEVGIGDTRIAGPGGQWDQAHWDTAGDVWSGVEPTWLDITCDCFSYACEYGRARTIDRFMAGSATVVVHNATGWADPHAVESPGQLTMRPGRAIRMGVVHDTYGTRWLFRGFLDAMNPTYDPVEMDTVEFACIDALGEINRAQLPELADPAYGGDTIDTRIGRILDAAKWPTTKRDLTPASDTVIAHNLGGQVADLLGQVADSGGGSVFGDVEGSVAFRGRDWQTFAPGTPPDGTIGNVEMGHIIPGTPAVPGYLTPTVGTVTTPSAGALPNDCVWVMKIRGPSNASGAPGIAGYGADAQQSWAVRRNAPTQGDFNVSLSSDGVGLVITRAIGAGAHPVTGADEWLALATTLNSGGRWYLGTARSTDGVTWTTVAPRTDVAAAVTVFAPTAAMRIGSAAGGTFNGRIYSVELRTGLDPAPTGRYLTPTVGTVTTPDPGPLPNEFVLLYKVRGPSGAIEHAIVSQFSPDAQRSWLIKERTDAATGITLTPNGLGSGAVNRYLFGQTTPTGADEALALAVTLDNGAGRILMRGWQLTGTAWAPIGAAADTGTSVAPFDSNAVVEIGAWAVTNLAFNGRIYSVELRTGLDPAAGTVVWRFDADEAPTDATTTTWTDPRGRTWTVTDPQAISGRTLWRFDADDYPGTGTSYVDPRGRTWTLSAAGAITPKVPAAPEIVVPPDVCPTQWERPFTRADMTTRVIIGRDTETAQLIDDTPAQNMYGIEPFTRTDLLTESDATITRLGQRILRTRAAATTPRIRSVSLDASTADNALDLMTTVDVYKPSRYRCRLRYPRGDVFDAEHFATAVSHSITPASWSLLLNLDLAAPWAAAGGYWDGANWDQATWAPAVALLEGITA